MMESPVEHLAKTHPNLEIWWDSSPLIYEKWVQEMLAAASPRRKPVLEEQLRRLYVAEDPARSVLRGCTTNPPFSLKAVQSAPEFWDRWVDDLILAHPDLGQKELFWLTYKELVKRGAEMFLPMFEASDGRYGWLSGQLDPRLATEKQLMIQQAEELRAIRPNVIVKVPATQEGLEVLKTLTAKGISTNTTVCFTLAQMIAAARAVKEGMELAAQQGVDLTRWRSVITMVVSFAPGAGQVILDIKLAPFSAAVVGFTVAYGAYMTEVFRAGIQSIPKGQMEAARSLGMNYLQAMRYIILPQAVRVILPPIGNEFVTLLKDSSLVSVLAVSDLTRRGREFVARTFLSFDTFTLVALIYLILTLFFTRVSTGIERRLAVEKR